MTRQAAAIAYDAAGNLPLSIGSRDADGNDAAVDSGLTSVPDNERSEAVATLRAEGFLVQSTQYADSLSDHAEADVLVALLDTQPRRIHVNVSVVHKPTVAQS